MVPISIIMPVYNSEKYISKTIDSILSQSYTEFELLLIDDCSSDRRIEKLLKSLEDEENIHRHTTCRGRVLRSS